MEPAPFYRNCFEYDAAVPERHTHPQFGEWDQMQQRTNQVLYAYWNDVRGDRIAPRRFDVEPSQLGSVLAETFILECGADQPPVFRLAGTRICDTFGREFRGAGFLELFRPDDRAAITTHLADVKVQGAVLVVTATATIDARRSVTFEIMLLPLIHTGASISRMLGAVAVIDAPGWLGSERLPPLELTAHSRIWPDGRPFAVVEKFRSAPALLPELAGARLVRVNRRSFRVLDGGLVKN